MNYSQGVAMNHEEKKNEIVIYQPNETIRIEVVLQNETVWLNRKQMAELFGRNVKTIGKHIKNALSEELSESYNIGDSTSNRNPVVANFATTATDGKVYSVEYYSLDVVLSVGYRVKSTQGIAFRRWLNEVLKSFLINGYIYDYKFSHLEERIDKHLAAHDKDISYRSIAKGSRKEMLRLYQNGCQYNSIHKSPDLILCSAEIWQVYINRIYRFLKIKNPQTH
jgi:prophage antirepressor-like protein